MMGNEEEAKDVLQEAFVTAFTRINKLKHEVTFSAWLKRIVINHCLNALKKKRLVTEELNENDDFVEADAGDSGFMEHEAKRVMQAIDRISEGCRTVLNLYLFEGYDHKEIGQILGVSEATSKAQYSKAKSKIRQLLENKEMAN